jgi:hypothetical protein
MAAYDRIAAVPNTPPPGTFDFTVGVDGTLQQILSLSTATLANKRVRVPPGVWFDDNFGPGGGPAHLYFLNKDFGNVTVVVEAGATLRSSGSGVEMFGQIRNIHFEGPGTIEGNGTHYYSEGFFIDGNRLDKGADFVMIGGEPFALPCYNISVDGLTIQPQAGTGSLQRNGLGVWGGDLVTLKNNTVHDCGGNTNHDYNGAGSGISCGHMKRVTAIPVVPGVPRVVIDNNHIYNVLETVEGVSADRNGIILDLYQGWDWNGTQNIPHFDAAGNPYFLIGDTVISNNNIHDVSGRGIQLLCGGMFPDGRVSILSNSVSGQWARRLDHPTNPGLGNPKTAIGGYGVGVCDNVICSDNTVTKDAGNGNKPSYYFTSFNAGNGVGVLGSNNHMIGAGSYVQWEASPTDTPPAGFIS